MRPAKRRPRRTVHEEPEEEAQEETVANNCSAHENWDVGLNAFVVGMLVCVSVVYAITLPGLDEPPPPPPPPPPLGAAWATLAGFFRLPTSEGRSV